jgi:KRAB domain-containing zinc finger protein
VLVEHHGASEQHPQPRILAVQPNSSADEEEGAIDLTRRKESEVKPSQTAITAEKTWANCPLCPARFDPDSKALQYHISLHGGNGPFRCRFCNYAVKAQENLTKHEKLHLHQTEDEDEMTAETTTTDNNTKPLKRFQCSKCPSSFEMKGQFKAHFNLYGSKQRYRCDRCDYAVKYYTNFLQHMKRHDESETAVDGADTTADEAMDVETHEPPPTTTAVPTIQLPEQPLSTADRQHI